jgi:predicted MPP superfamily phosphohydrolase
MDERSIQPEFLKTLWIEFVDLAFRAINRIGHGVFGEPNEFEVETVKIKLNRLPGVFSGFRIVQISDIHMGGWMNLERLHRVADLVTAQKPDVLVITGDFLKGRSFTQAAKQGIRDLTKVLRPLAAAIPTFAVLGNHDYRTSPTAIREMLRLCKITDLTNDVFTLRRKDAKLFLCGVDDIRHGKVRLNDVLAQLDENSPAILLVHEPDFADISAATGKFDLQISGHSHGGQIVVPFYGPPRLPESGRKYPRGRYQVGKMIQYTNRGVGVDRFAVRINCPPEITVFVLESGR